MAEWLKAHAWKACKGETLSWVRIPFSPPFSIYAKTFRIELLTKIKIYCIYNYGPKDFFKKKFLQF